MKIIFHISLLSMASMLVLFAGGASAKSAAVYSYAAQKQFIHKDLGKVYLGMPLRDFAREFNLSKAEVGDLRFDWFELDIPVNKKRVKSLRIRVHGLSMRQKSEMVVTESYSDQEDVEVTRLVVSEIPDEGFVYAMYVTFQDGFNLKKYAVKTFGSDGTVRKPDDEFHFYDIQWSKETSDGLKWLVRAFHEKEPTTLQLLGRIPGTEWSAS